MPKAAQPEKYEKLRCNPGCLAIEVKPFGSSCVLTVTSPARNLNLLTGTTLANKADMILASRAIKRLKRTRAGMQRAQERLVSLTLS